MLGTAREGDSFLFRFYAQLSREGDSFLSRFYAQLSFVAYESRCTAFATMGT